MARQEQDREDLLAEATALVRRVELNVPACGDAVVIGFRRDGEASFYLDPDTVYHFNASGQLRRAYCEGLLYKAQRGRLISLDRQRRDGQVQLLRRELSVPQQATFLAKLAGQLRQLQVELSAGRFDVRGQVPDGEDIVGSAVSWLSESADSPDVAGAPGIA